jgi:non-homologous end joining protein Ku
MLATPWNPAAFRDDFRDKLHKFVEQRVVKASGGKLHISDRL